jgi:hypothetical protein
MRVVTILGTVTLASSVALFGCRKQADQPPPTADTATPESTITEEGESGAVSWDVGTDGQVRASLKTPDGKPITKNIRGTVTWPGEMVDTQAELVPDEKGVLVASGPPLQEDLTQIDYALEVDGKPWVGVLHVPRGGTRAIEEDARVAAQVTVPAGKRGPNGGVIQYVGGEPVEMVADKSSQEVRLYVLDRDYNVIDPGERTVRLGYGAEYPGVSVLVREPGANYYVGPWYADYSPFRVTVAMTVGVETHVGIVGWSYGAPLRFGIGFAAPVAFVGVYGWAPSVSVSMGVGFGFGWGVGWGVYGGAYRVSVVERVGYFRGRGWVERGHREHWDRGRHEGWEHGRGGDHGHGDRGFAHGGEHGGHHDMGGGHHDMGGGHGMMHSGGGGHGSPGGGHVSAPSRGGGGRSAGGGRHR